MRDWQDPPAQVFASTTTTRMRACLVQSRTHSWTRYRQATSRRPCKVLAAAAAPAPMSGPTAWCWEQRQRCVAQLKQPEASNAAAVLIRPVTTEQLEGGASSSSSSSSGLTDSQKQWASIQKFKGKAGELLLLPGADGALSQVLLGVAGAPSDLWAYSSLPAKLPPGVYRMPQDLPEAGRQQALLGWMLGCYKFDRYKTPPADGTPPQPADLPHLVTPEVTDRESLVTLAEAFFWCRALITTPAEDLGPQHMAAEAAALADHHPGAALKTISGEELLVEGYPAVHTVGRAAARPPVLLDLTWSPRGVTPEAAGDLPLVALVGKGVCFDSGGLDIKTAAGMKLMKKDMGGAALMLSLAHVLMTAQLPVRLRVLVPAVENAISGNAYRPLDVLQTRAGITVENGNTDAEGRLILCDALAEACSSTPPPDVVIDAATLTGAARTALGPELPAVFSKDAATWQALEEAAEQEGDPVWRLPLHASYRRMLDSKVADISSTGEPGQAGAITAALFLAEFTKAAPRWMHIDTGAWVSGAAAGPGRPEGGEALGLRALARFLKERYAAGGAAAGSS